MRHGFQRALPALLVAPAVLLTWLGALQANADRLEAPPPPVRRPAHTAITTATALHAADGDTPHRSRSTSLPPSVVGNIISHVSSAELEAHVCHLQDQDALGYCNTRGSRFSLDPAGLNEAAAYIAGVFQQHGLSVTLQPFTVSHVPPDQVTAVVLTNVIGTLEGIAPEAERGVVIISAHYDSTSHDASAGGPAPGADDNASGVAAVLEAARLLSEHTLWHTVRFVTFAGEEQGLLGSHHYAETARTHDENITAVINADMIAYDGNSEPRMEVHAGLDPHSAAIAHTFVETAQAYSIALLPQVIRDAAIRASDHASFWDRGFPAILAIEDTERVGPTEDFNPYYHTEQDTLDKINRSYFTQMARAVVGTVVRLAEPVGPDLWLIQQGPELAMPGRPVTFTLSYSNVGTAPATSVLLTDTLSYGLIYRSDSSGLAPTFGVAGQVTWDMGDLEAGSGGAFVVTASVLSGLEEGLALRSSATIAARDLDADAADNVATVEMVVGERQRTYLALLINY